MDNHYIHEIIAQPYNEDTYVSSLSIIKYLNKAKKLSFDQDITFIIGENGSGKSTLIEALAVCAGYNAEGGSKNFNFFSRITNSDFHEYLTIVKKAYEKDGFFLRAESFYNVASQVDDLRDVWGGNFMKGYGGRSLHGQSHGESFLALVKSRFRGKGLYFLDEPESAMSPLGQFAMMVEFRRLIDDNSQLIVATHSPILMAYPNAVIYQITDAGIERVEYKKCDHYVLTKRFLDDPESFLGRLI